MLDPGADGYVKNVENCAAKLGNTKIDCKGFHDFSCTLISNLGGEMKFG